MALWQRLKNQEQTEDRSRWPLPQDPVEDEASVTQTPPEHDESYADDELLGALVTR